MKEKLPGYQEVRAVVIRSDIKLGGVTGARVIGCDDEEFYVCKSTRFIAYRQPYLLANEQIAHNLACLLSLPIQPAKVINLRGERLFGSLLVPRLKDLKTVRLTRENVKNWQEVPGILIFDIFVCNVDRHLGNNLALVNEKEEFAFTIRIMDHSHALMGSSVDRKASLQDQYLLSHYLNLVELNGFIEEESDFEPALAGLEELERNEIAWAVQNMPVEWLPNHQENCRFIIQALVRRRDKVRKLLEKQVKEETGLPPIQRLFSNLTD